MTNPTGRPTKLTPELEAEIIGYIREGMYVEQACILAGITKPTYYNWKARGEAAAEGDDAYVRFLYAATQAETQAEVESVRAIRDTDKEKDWRGHAWFLERRARSRWGKSVEQRITYDAPPPTIELQEGQGPAVTE